jgi:SSS family solute:Na+ symporter
MFQFVLDDYIGIHFIHLYAILFFTEIGIMLLVGYFSPRLETWTFHRKEVVDLTPWRYAVPCAATLLSCVIVVYLLFSPLGLVNGTSVFFLPLVALLLFLNILVWYLYSKAIHSS